MSQPKKETSGMPQTPEPWRTLSSELPLVNPWYAIRRDRVWTHLGDEITYTYIDHPGVVFIVPVTADGDIVLIEQYRYPVHAWCWEVPAGGIEAGEEPAVAAARELAEEVGAVVYHLESVTTFYANNGISNERAHVYLAKNVEIGQRQLEPTELLRVVKVPQDEALRMARAGEITDGQSALALMLCEPYLRSST
jgi:ADP-ribose pyrophosphatase